MSTGSAAVSSDDGLGRGRYATAQPHLDLSPWGCSHRDSGSPSFHPVRRDVDPESRCLYSSTVGVGDAHPHPLPPRATTSPRAELPAAAGLGAAVDRDLAGLEHLPRRRAVLDETGELEELAEADAVVADLDVADGRAASTPASVPGGACVPVVGWRAMGVALLVLAGRGRRAHRVDGRARVAVLLPGAAGGRPLPRRRPTRPTPSRSRSAASARCSAPARSCAARRPASCACCR